MRDPRIRPSITARESIILDGVKPDVYQRIKRAEQDRARSLREVIEYLDRELLKLSSSASDQTQNG